MTPLLVPISDGSIIPAGHRDASDAEILRAGADIIDRRIHGFGKQGAQALRDMAYMAEAMDKMTEMKEEL